MPIETEIMAERIAADFRQLPLAVLVSAINALLMAGILSWLGAPPGVGWWVAGVFAVGAARLALWRELRRAPAPRAVALGRWALPMLAGLAGLLWGSGAILLAPEAELYRLFWAFVIGGMCAGATALHAAYLPSLLAYLGPACLPVALALGLGGSPPEQLAAAMIVVFIAALAQTGARSSRAFGETLRLRLDLAARTAALEATSEQLRQSLAEQQATATALRHVQKMEAVGQLAGGIAHDLSNLMTAVLGSLSLLRPRLASAEAQALTLLDTAMQGAERAATLTQRLLTFGRRQAPRPEAVDPAALIRNMVDLLRGALRPGITLTLELPPSPPWVFLEASQLELALLNLARNASDAMPAGGQIVIRLREAATPQDGDAIVIEVADTGEGMDAVTLRRAMEPFFTTKPVGRGTGLGLSMVHGFAAQSGGRLALRSEPGMGTTVEIWLPRSRLLAQPSDPEANPQGAGRAPGRVLLVDDDPLVLASTAAMLEDLGHSVIEAPTGAQALTVLNGGEPIDLVITDQAMPDLTGLQLAAAVQRLRPGLPVLLATADPALVDSTARLPCLSKPFDQAALARATESCLAPHAGAPPRVT